MTMKKKALAKRKTKTSAMGGAAVGGMNRILRVMIKTEHRNSSIDLRAQRIFTVSARVLRPLLLACSLVCVVGGSFAFAPAVAQQRGAEPRVIQGRVVDKSGTPVKGAVVYLKDDHTLAIKSFLAGDDGSYRFGQLSQSVDYEVWAELDGKKSPTRSVSSFDTKTTTTIELKVDTGK